MKRLVLITLALLAFITISPHLSANELSRFYCSPGSTQNPYMSFLTNAGSYLDLYYLDESGVLQSQNSTMYLGNEEWNKTVVENSIGHDWVGYHGIYYLPNGKSRFGMANPIYFPDEGPAPQTMQMMEVEFDPPNDNAFGLNHQDILGTRVSFSQSKLYYGIKVNSSTFPVSSGLTFYSYMGLLVDPMADPATNPIVYGLMHTVNVAGVIGTGLYKITGTGTSDLTLIGEVEVTPDAANGTLILSCDLADLYADPDFASWFNPDYPLISTQAITSRITIANGTQTADDTGGFAVLLLPKEFDYTNEHTPEISDLQYTLADGLMDISLHYFDADLNHAISITARVDEGEEHQMHPTINEGIENGIDFSSTGIDCPEVWDTITISYLEGGVYHQFIYNNPVSNSDEIAPAAQLKVYPNPTGSMIYYQLDKLLRGNTEIKIYNLRGQQIRSLIPQSKEGSIDLTGLPSGIYYFGYGDVNRRFFKL